MPLILSGNVASATAAAYTVANSCRFNDDDSAYMHKTPSSSGSQRTFTFSTWWKQGDLASTSIIFSSGGGGPNFAIYYDGSQQFNVLYYEGSTLLQLITNAVYRDPSAWYHICVAIDTTQSTDTNRAKIYINGSQVTSLATETYCNQNVDISINTSSYRMAIGAGVSDGDIADGYAAETVLIDGQQLTPTSFGEFDSASPTIWKPIDVSGLTFGTNGFYLDFEDSANLGNDANGGTDLTEVNLAAADQCQDSPTNNYNTMNPLVFRTTSGTIYTPTFSEGNTYVFSTQDSTYDITGGTFMVSSGKWYFEWKNAGVGDTSADFSNGVGVKPADGSFDGTSSYLGTNRCYCANGNKADSASVGGSAYGDSWTTDDIIGCYLDLDNSKIYFAKNGTMQNSADVSDGTGFAFDDLNSHDSWIVFNAMADFGVGSQSGNYFNFGNPAFTISSSNSDANGYGSFEYNPTEDGVDFYALCTKNLAEYG